MDDKVDPIIRMRQKNCKHPPLIKGPADNTSRCPHCGVSQADLEAMQAEAQANAWSHWSGGGLTYNP